MIYKMSAYPSKFIPMSASVLLMRPQSQSSRGSNYEILLLKRAENLRFGSYFAFPGGMIEKQDYVHKWVRNYTTFTDEIPLKHTPDFTKRMACIRELFEECNILLSDNQAPRSSYIGEYDSNFIKFCKEKQIKPALTQLHACFRLGSPIGFYPCNDTQFYVHFCGKEIDEQLSLNAAEFTEAKWLTVEEALDQYQKGSMDIFFPQIMILCQLKFLSKDFNELRNIIANKLNSNWRSYITNKGHMINFASIIKEHKPNQLNGEA